MKGVCGTDLTAPWRGARSEAELPAETGLAPSQDGGARDEPCQPIKVRYEGQQVQFKVVDGGNYRHSGFGAEINGIIVRSVGCKSDFKLVQSWRLRGNVSYVRGRMRQH